MSRASNDDLYSDAGYFGNYYREARHNPCLMAPLSFVMLVICGIFFLVTLLFQVPSLVLGLLLAPILSKSAWHVEFLYPWGVARWAHFLLISQAAKKGRSDDKNRGFHSRTIEQKIEVIPGRIYIHPIPQWLDNLGYLVVCLPRPKTENRSQVKITIEDETDPVVALMVDCGDAEATIRAVEMIKQQHYRNKSIHIQSILSTHKHHDHTGGNKQLMEDDSVGEHINRIYGGAVEKVPYCTHKLANGDFLELPRYHDNDMGELVEIEAVAVPAHTRGSMVYRLRSKATATPVEFLFTGDTMFSAGGGVPFEADAGNETEGQLHKSTGNTFFRAGLGNHAMERCFAEILSRAFPNENDSDIGDRILIFPGHEYTSELLSRQFQSTMLESCRWKNYAPRDFFETASNMFVSLHRRSLPHNSGKLLMIPSTMQREIRISPHFRSMRKTADVVIRALVFWYTHFCQDKGEEGKPAYPLERNKKSGVISLPKTASTPRKWYVGPEDVQKEVFTTVYTADLDSVIEQLASGSMSKKEAARKLQDIGSKLDEPVVNRRAIPDCLPSDKSIYKGVAGLVLLGAPPSAMTLSDSRTMHLPPPISSNSDLIHISMKRLITVLRRMGMPNDPEDGDIECMIRRLWQAATEYLHSSSDAHHYNGDVESVPITDKIELGVLKWVIYGVPANQPSWFSKICCMPCSTVPNIRSFPSHPSSKMKQKSGDLVSHDVLTCLLCRNATGYVQLTESQLSQEEQQELVLPRRETESDDSLGDVHGTEMEEIANHLLLKEHE